MNHQEQYFWQQLMNDVLSIGADIQCEAAAKSASNIQIGIVTARHRAARNLEQAKRNTTG